jgi:quinolinate synthase
MIGNETSLAGAEELVVDSPMLAEIARLKAQHHAVILAHNYQYGVVQDIADFVGDSLGLSQEAARTDAEVIVFCGVHFMAETAAILCPEKTVLLPDLQAGCSLADAITAEQLRAWKAEHPNAVVVAYINTTAEVKAESDYCCTSGNAVKVVESIPPEREILFLPDMFLGSYVHHVTGRPIRTWAGECHVHAAITPAVINHAQQTHPNAEMVIHPECGCVTSCMQAKASGDLPNGDAIQILSTEGMMRHIQASTAQEFVIATEVGVLHRMRKAAPTKTFLPISETTVCQYMKMITPAKILAALQHKQHQITVEPQIATRARRAIERMLALA